MKKYAAIAVCVLLAAGAVAWVRLAGTSDAAHSTPESPRPSPVDEQISRPPAQIARESVRTRVAGPVPASEKAVPELGGSDWAVVAAIYKDYGAAKRRADTVSEGSLFKATVFPPEGTGTKYMVVLDSGLTQTKAMQIRDRAVASGLPADTYVTRLVVRQ